MSQICISLLRVEFYIKIEEERDSVIKVDPGIIFKNAASVLQNFIDEKIEKFDFFMLLYDTSYEQVESSLHCLITESVNYEPFHSMIGYLCFG